MAKLFYTKAEELYDRRFDAEYHCALKNVRLSSVYPSTKLLSLSSFRTGGTPSTEVADYWNGDIPWVSAKDFKSFRFEDSEDHITEKAIADGTTYFVNRPALLVVNRSGILQHTLPVMVTHRPTAINQDIKAFFPDNRITVDYLGAFFDVFGNRLLPLLCKSGATVQSLNTKELVELCIPIPPREVQEKIVSELDAAYTAKRKADEKATELLASIDNVVLDALGIPPLPPPDTSLSARIFIISSQDIGNNRLDAFHYNPYFRLNIERIREKSFQPLKSLIELSHDMWGQESWNDENDGYFPYLEIGAISTEDGSVLDVSTIPIEEAPSRARMIANRGDLLVSLTRPTRKAIAFVPEAFDKLVASTGFAIIRKTKPSITMNYLFEVLRTELCTLQFDQRSSGGNYPAITEEQLLKCIIPVPPMFIQEEIATKASMIRAEAKAMKSAAATELAASKKIIESFLMEENK